MHVIASFFDYSPIRTSSAITLDITFDSLIASILLSCNGDYRIFWLKTSSCYL